MGTDSRLPRRLAISVSVGLGLLLAVAGLAYACTAQSEIKLEQAAAYGGDTVTGSGGGFGEFGDIAPAEIEVRFDGMDGPLLWKGVPESGKITFSFAVPDVDPGYYVVTARRTDYDGEPAKAPLEILAASNDNGGDQQTASGEEESTQPATRERQTSDSPGTQTSSSATQSQDTSSESSPSTARSDASVQDEQSEATEPAAADAEAGTGNATVPTETAAPDQDRELATLPGSPSAQTATGDLWSGLAPDNAPGVTDSPASDTTPAIPAGLLIGMVLLAAGPALLLGGFSVAALRRRRARARAEDTQ